MIKISSNIHFPSPSPFPLLNSPSLTSLGAWYIMPRINQWDIEDQEWAIKLHNQITIKIKPYFFDDRF